MTKVVFPDRLGLPVIEEFKMPDPTRGFTANEVAALVENIEKKIDTVLEILSPLQEDVNVLKEDNAEIKERLTRIEDAVRVSVPDLNKRVSKLEAKVSK